MQHEPLEGVGTAALQILQGAAAGGLAPLALILPLSMSPPGVCLECLHLSEGASVCPAAQLLLFVLCLVLNLLTIEKFKHSLYN